MQGQKYDMRVAYMHVWMTSGDEDVVSLQRLSADGLAANPEIVREAEGGSGGDGEPVEEHQYEDWER